MLLIKVEYRGRIICASSWEEVFNLMKWVDDEVDKPDFKSICLSGGAVEVV